MTAPALDMLWIVLLVLAVVAVPQALGLDRRERGGARGDESGPMSPRRRLDIFGAVALLIGVVGVIVKPSLMVLWAFLIVFGVTTVPERLFRWLRERRRA